jgi:manganese oxidase
MRVSQPFVVLVALAFSGFAAASDEEHHHERCRAISADVVALDQAFYVNRLGALQTGGMIFALRRDVVPNDGSNQLKPGAVMLRPDKRPRPIVLRMNVGDCLTIHFQNLLAPQPAVVSGDSQPIVDTPGSGFDPAKVKMVPNNAAQDTDAYDRIQSATRYAGIHIMGMQLRKVTPQTGIQSDGSWVGTNDSSLVAPGGRITYEFFAEAEGAYLLYSTGADVGVFFAYGGQLSQGLFGAVTVQPKRAEWYRSSITHADWQLVTTLGPEGFPIVDYDKKRADGTPILKMVNHNNEIVYTDLSAIITGPDHGLFPEHESDDEPEENPSYPNRRQPYREFVVLYHDDFTVAQAFPQFTAFQGSDQFGGQPLRSPLFNMLSAGRDFFAINYGIGGIGPEVWANRIGVGPMETCATCKFEEFFLSSWTAGDPAMVVDFPANSSNGTIGSDGYPVVVPGRKATKVFFPDDPSNVYHGYIGDHTKYRILHAGTSITHVHHQHAHQWLHSPNSDESHYRDSQMLSPGAAYTLDYVYRGSGNKNEVVGDAIFHCHFYPHFAQGMWGLWRQHDVLEEGTVLDNNGRPVAGWNRALPDGEISTGTPIPAIVPMPTYAMAPLPARVQICPSEGPKDFVQYSGANCPAVNPALTAGFRTLVNDTDLNAGKNPGFPFFVPGLAGQRAPHPPLDFAPDNSNPGTFLDGGLPRHVVFSELSNKCSASPFTNCMYEQHNQWDFSKDNDNLLAVQINEAGTPVEKVAMNVHAVRNHATRKPDGTPGTFLLNGKPPVSGAPFANPGVNLDGTSPPPATHPPFPPSKTVVYKAANIQTNVVLNKKGWHYPQQRMVSLWGDVNATLNGTKRPEPLFLRVNSGDQVEFWHANLVPNYYDLDDFQVRTPTDILGQHIHLVKFDVLASDGAANGFNYEDGTFSPDEVRETIDAINKFFNASKTGGLFSTDASAQNTLTAKPIPFFGAGPGGAWVGAQATIQRWYADPLLNHACDAWLHSDCHDRTIQTVFTHDHFGPSTHQQAGLYAGLVIEPAGSKWLNAETGVPLPNPARDDGGPTSWQAIIVSPDKGPGAGPNYREFLLEFQDRQLAYVFNSRSQPLPYQRYTPGNISSSKLAARPCSDPFLDAWGWADPCSAVNKPFFLNQNLTRQYAVSPKLITNHVSEGTYSVNYSNEPLPYRVANPVTPPPNPPPPCSGGLDPLKLDLAHVFQSFTRCDPQLNVQPAAGTPIDASKPAGFKFAPPQPGAGPTDPYTPLLRAYEGEHIQIRNLVGAHQVPHSFNVHGLKWLFEPAFTDSGYRSTQGMGISEHYEFLFQLPKLHDTAEQTDYLYESSSEVPGLTGGNWGLLRAYNKRQTDLFPVPSKHEHEEHAEQEGAGCTEPNRKFDVTAAFGRDILSGPLVYNARGDALNPGMNQIVDWNAMMYVRTDDLDPITHKLKPNAPREPLILRAAAGDCIQVTLRNRLLPPDEHMNRGRTVAMIGRDPTLQNVKINTSHEVGLHAQLVSYDMSKGDGVNVGLNPTVTVGPGKDTVFNWYAGLVKVNHEGEVKRTPVEFGAISLSPADPLMQHPYGLVGGLIIEPRRSKWKEDSNSHASAVVTTEDDSKFREFAAVVQDDLAALRFTASIQLQAVTGSTWTVDGTLQSNNFQLTLGEGDVVAVQVESGLHGFSFLDKDNALSAFKIVGGIPFAAQSGVGPKAFGTPGETAGTGPNGVVLLAILQVKPLSEIPSSVTSVAFECTIDKTAMAGSFVIQRPPPSSTPFPPPNTLPSPAGWTRAINYRTEPLSYRFANENWLQNTPPQVPVGITRALTDELVQADPQTPVFVAARGVPVRMRFFHPAGSNEEVMTLHGHFWQEEPYTHDSTRIGHNSHSQSTGSRDAFGANASFDMVLDHAGGIFGVPGDYLFRTVIGNDFVFGMWGLVRVGDPGKDVCQVTRFEKVEAGGGTNRIIVAGVNTVNTDTGEMARLVEIFAGVDPGKAKLGTADLDPLTGTWVTEFAVTTVPDQITVVSPLGGMVVSAQTPAPAVGKAAAISLKRLFGRRAIESDPNVNDFRNPPAHDELPSDKSARAPETHDKSPGEKEPRR